MENLKVTCLHDSHIKLGALMSPFAGFNMPIQYKSIEDEHIAVRTDCGIFDVSHMGEVLVEGKDAEKFVNYIFTNDVTDAQPGKCFYGMMLNQDGGVVDDLLVYKKSDTSFLLVINASNIDKDISWILKYAKDFEIKIENLSEIYGEIAIQGPNAEKVIENNLEIEVADLEFYTFKETEWNGENIIISRTGYTGEDGFEIYASHNIIKKIWDLLVDSGATVPCGLGCRDTLRFEAGLPLYGDELTDDITPIEAGLGMFVKLEKDNFIGKDSVEKQKSEGPKRKIVGIELLEKAIPRHGYEVLNTYDEVIGTITTGYHSISTGKDIAMALIDSKYSTTGTPVKVRIRKKVFQAIVTTKKFYKKNYKQ